MGDTKKTASRPDQMRISLVFHMDDPLEKAAYELLSAKTVKKSRSHLVSQAVLGFMYLDNKKLLDTYTIENIIDKAVASAAEEFLQKIQKEGIAVSPASASAEPTLPAKMIPSIVFTEEPKAEAPVVTIREEPDEKQAAAIEDMLVNFMNM